MRSEDDHSEVQLNPLKEDYVVSNIEEQDCGVGIYQGCGDEVDEEIEMDNEVNSTTMNSGEIITIIPNPVVPSNCPIGPKLNMRFAKGA